ncbi:MAG: M90 family metallopeptidase [Microthrixaceae bacterium]
MGIFRRRPPEDALPEGWRSLLAERIRHWEYLSDDERDQLGHLSGQLLSEKHWEASNGFDLTTEMKMLIAAQASLLVLGLSFGHFREVSAIIVHPTTVVLTGPRGSAVSGLMTDSPMPILGQAAEWGPIIIAWDAVLNDCRHPERGHNVVFHEFAHKLDMLDHVVDGTPPLQRDQWERWVEVCTREYESLQAGGDDVLGDYASVNPAEFFAVATEAFFDIPVRLRDQKLELYEVLAAFYNQDPAARVERSASRGT